MQVNRRGIRRGDACCFWGRFTEDVIGQLESTSTRPPISISMQRKTREESVDFEGNFRLGQKVCPLSTGRDESNSDEFQIDLLIDIGIFDGQMLSPGTDLPGVNHSNGLTVVLVNCSRC